jgi:hypothetical protein
MTTRRTAGSPMANHNKGPGKSQQTMGNRNKAQRRPGLETGKPLNVLLMLFYSPSYPTFFIFYFLFNGALSS